MYRPTTAAALALALIALGCGGAATSSPTTGNDGADVAIDESAPAEEQVVAMVEALASRVSRAGDDCAGVNGGMAGWLDTYEARIATLTEQVEASNSGVSNARVDELDARLDRAWDAVFVGAKACSEVAKPSIDRLDALFAAR